MGHSIRRLSGQPEFRHVLEFRCDIAIIYNVDFWAQKLECSELILPVHVSCDTIFIIESIPNASSLTREGHTVWEGVSDSAHLDQPSAERSTLLRSCGHTHTLRAMPIAGYLMITTVRDSSLWHPKRTCIWFNMDPPTRNKNALYGNLIIVVSLQR